MFACEPVTSITITADAEGFARATAHAHARAGGVVHAKLKLSVTPVETDAEVNANAGGIDCGFRTKLRANPREPTWSDLKSLRLVCEDYRSDLLRRL